MADGTDAGDDPAAPVRDALDRLAHAGDPSALRDPSVDRAAATTIARAGVDPDRLAVAWYL